MKTDVPDTLREDGYAILPGAVDQDTVAWMRGIVLENLHAMANTRPTPSARHIAGFHRLPTLQPLHEKLLSNAALQAAMTGLFAPSRFHPIGLSDITVNRSQPWHTDLLRGKYADYLTPEMCWGEADPGCLKVLLYLQEGRSLKVIPGSHRRAVSLADDSAVVPSDMGLAREVPVNVGDIVLMDIRLVHRGSTEEEMAAVDRQREAKILISTVLGDQKAKLTQAMQRGNAHRVMDWEARHLARQG